MTNAVDVLCVGGVKHEVVVCVNKAIGVFPTNIDFYHIGGGATLTYTRRAYYNQINDRWYWIATHPDDEPSTEEINAAIAFTNFQPAWDMRDKEAPINEGPQT